MIKLHPKIILSKSSGLFKWRRSQQPHYLDYTNQGIYTGTHKKLRREVAPIDFVQILVGSLQMSTFVTPKSINFLIVDGVGIKKHFLCYKAS